MIRVGLMDGAKDCACVAGRPAKLEEVAYELVGIIGETLTPCGDVKMQTNGETKCKGIRTRRRISEARSKGQ